LMRRRKKTKKKEKRETHAKKIYPREKVEISKLVGIATELGPSILKSNRGGGKGAPAESQEEGKNLGGHRLDVQKKINISGAGVLVEQGTPHNRREKGPEHCGEGCQKKRWRKPVKKGKVAGAGPAKPGKKKKESAGFRGVRLAQSFSSSDNQKLGGESSGIRKTFTTEQGGGSPVCLRQRGRPQRGWEYGVSPVEHGCP